MKNLVFNVLVLLIFVSCSIIEYVKTGREYPSLSKNAEIRVFLSKIPKKKYVEIGVIETKSTLENSLLKAKKKARSVGGNALIKLQGVYLKFVIIRILRK